MGEGESGKTRFSLIDFVFGLDYPGKWLWRFKWYRAAWRWHTERGLPKDSPYRSNIPFDEG